MYVVLEEPIDKASDTIITHSSISVSSSSINVESYPPGNVTILPFLRRFYVDTFFKDFVEWEESSNATYGNSGLGDKNLYGQHPTPLFILSRVDLTQTTLLRFGRDGWGQRKLNSVIQYDSTLDGKIVKKYDPLFCSNGHQEGLAIPDSRKGVLD
jgi:hypothetical protein